MEKEIIYSAIQPTGPLHLGNYFGALKQFVELQNKYKCYFVIADLHSMTTNFDPKNKKEQILSLAEDYLAIGLDPEKCIMFVQSQISEVVTLEQIFKCIIPLAYLERMTQYKDKKRSKKEEEIMIGLLNYPVLQAADILLFKAAKIPVGKDQLQHIELARIIAKKFNNKFGKTFSIPKAILSDTPKIMSLTHPFKKMSKSASFGVLNLNPDSYIALTDSPEIIKKKISRAKTESTGVLDAKKAKTDEGMRGAFNLLELLKLFGKEKEYKKFKNAEKISYKELKEVLADAIIEYFEDFRKNKKYYKAHRKEVLKVLKEGKERAKPIAQKTMEEVRKKVGIDID